MIKRDFRLSKELENFYIGWIYNPIVGLWNRFADHHNARFEASRVNPSSPPDEQEGWFATLNGKTTRFREHWLQEDLTKLLDEATHGQFSHDLQRQKSKGLKKRP